MGFNWDAFPDAQQPGFVGPPRPTSAAAFNWDEFPDANPPAVAPAPAVASMEPRGPSRSPASSAPVASDEDQYPDAKPMEEDKYPDAQPMPVKAGISSYDVLFGDAGERFLEKVVVPVGRAVDRYTGAPSRAALGKMQDGGNIGDAATAFKNQWGADPEQAPTGKQMAEKAGWSTTPFSETYPSLYSETGNGWQLKRGGLFDSSPAGVAGLGVDVATDWTNVLPPATIAKYGLRGAKELAPIAKGAARVGAATADVATGTRMASVGGELAYDAGSHVKSIIGQITNPKIQPTWQQSVAVATKNGINPDLLSPAVKYGERSQISRMQRVLAEGNTPGAEKMLNDHAEGYHQISKAIVNKSKEIAGGGALIDEIHAGDIIHEGLKRAQKNLLDASDITYESAGKYAPGLFMNKTEMVEFNSKLNGTERWAKGELRRGVGSNAKSEAKEVMNIVNDLRNTNGSYKQTVQQLKRLGKIAFEDKPVLGQVPIDTQKMRDLYFSLSDAVTGTVRRDIAPEFADELVANNKAMSSFFKDRESVSGALDPSRAGEQIFNRFIVNGDSKGIGILTSRMDPKDVAKIKGAFLRSVLKPTEDGLLSFDRAANALRQKENQVSVLFAPSEVKEIGELIKIGKKHGMPIMSTSGTGASISFNKGIWDRAADAVTKSYTNEKSLEWMKGRADRVADAANIPQATVDLGDFSPAGRTAMGNRFIKAPQSVAPSYYDERPKNPDNPRAEKWQLSGFQKLMQHDPNGPFKNNGALIDKAFSNPRIKDLLSQASDLPPGSRAMQGVYDQIQNELRK